MSHDLSATGAAANADTATPPPSTMKVLRQFLNDKSPLTVLRHFLGESLTDAPALLDKAVFVGLDMEWFEYKPEMITEVGLAIFSGNDLKQYSVDRPVQELLKKIRIFHARVIENCHYINRDLSPAAVGNFLLGQTRWITIGQAKEVVDAAFAQGRYPDGQKYEDNETTQPPVIFLGHGLSEDIKNLREQWEVDLQGYDNIVFTMQTTPLAKAARVLGERGMKLKGLLQGFGIKPSWLHNAGNDIAYTSVVALLIGLKPHLFPDGKEDGFPKDEEGQHVNVVMDFRDTGLPFPVVLVQGEPINSVMHEMRDFAKAQPQSPIGYTSYCYKCETPGHLRQKCKAPVELCKNCLAAKGPMNLNIRAQAKNHTTSRCSCGPYYKYEPLPEWVKQKLSKVQVRQFQTAKMTEDVETLGQLVLESYPAWMRGDEEINVVKPHV